MSREPEVPPGPAARTSPRQVTLVALVAATYFMVSGGPFGLEDLIADAGYRGAVVILVVTPVIWSLPVAMAVGELAAAYPEEGGYYAWVKRALGPFWGVEEAWLSLAASFFDLAIYPTLFTRYLAQLWAPAGTPLVAVIVGVGLIALATAINLRGARATTDASVALGVALLAPFAALTAAACLGPSHADLGLHLPHGGGDRAPFLAGLGVAMWNYMGWDNASTIAGEVKDPARAYPRAMALTVALVAVTYVVPVAAMEWSGVSAQAWTAGTWAVAGQLVAGRWLAVAIAVAGMISSAGMLLSLVMSYARLPLVLARDGYLPAWLGRTHPETGAPWVALLVCGALYAACLGLGFKRLVELDVIIYGASLALEFVALVALRIKDPHTARPFRVPGGLAGAVLVGIVPMGLLALSLVGAAGEEGGGWVVLAVTVVVALGVVLYAVGRPRPVAVAVRPLERGS